MDNILLDNTIELQFLQIRTEILRPLTLLTYFQHPLRSDMTTYKAENFPELQNDLILRVSRGKIFFLKNIYINRHLIQLLLT